MLGDEIRKKIKKNDKRPQNSSNIKEWRPNSKQKKNKGRININWFKGKIEKNQIFDQKYQNKNPKKKKNKIKHEAKTK
jgi:hypothetical protein